ncbi:uncharacterized mitochondrial protein AtMg00860-like [Magnolia sinica]|uniref:uncharacterized mitochondrial protein AtMg00860-like n=1 Tax=Magnolia sinica TaxID=86752 RepID=UPI002659B49B|nr:uncharacterized mitochondrial protein AtMg00860-like [Magnolia sinica]
MDCHSKTVTIAVPGQASFTVRGRNRLGTLESLQALSESESVESMISQIPVVWDFPKVKEVKFLGHVVKAEGIVVDPAKVKAVSKWEQPTMVTEVQSFLGMARYYKRFIKKFSRIVRPLTQLTKKNARFTLDENAEAAFQELKMRLTSAPVLTLPQEGETFVLYSDASKMGLSCVLMQIDRVIAYASR